MSDVFIPEKKVLFPRQREFLRAGSTAKAKIAIGSTRSGKSVALAVEAVKMAIFAPEGPLLFVARTLSNVHSNICEVIRETFGTGYITDTSPKHKECYLLGRKVLCRGADDAAEAEKLKGLTISGAICDEVSTYPESVFMMILTRLDRVGSHMVGSTNPDAPMHWLKRLLDKEGVPILEMKFSLDDNPLVDEAYKKFLMSTLHGAYLRRYYYGEWAAAEGLVYTDFGDHLVGDHSDHAASEFVCGIDFGLRHKTEAVIVASNASNNPKLWVPRALSIDQNPSDVQTVSEVAKTIVEWLSPQFPAMIYVDPAALVLKTELRRHLPRGVQVLGANNDVLNGIHYVCRLFSNREIAIDRSCSQLIKELYSYSWDETKSVRSGRDEVKKSDDDGVDALRYALYSRFGNFDDPVSVARKRGDETIRRNSSLPSYKKILGGYREHHPSQTGGSYF